MTQERQQLRQVFFDCWQKHLNKQPVEPLEAQIIDIILQHPEYHHLLEQRDQFIEQDFSASNPFLHLSLHLALREQVSTNRPVGIKKIYAALTNKLNSSLAAEHQMIPCLEETLWHAQQSGVMPDEEIYLENLKRLL